MTATQSLVHVLLPTPEASLNVRALAQHAVESFTGGVSVTLVLTNEPAPVVRVAWNGTLLNPAADYTLVGRTVTLSRAPVAGDLLEVEHHYRPQRP